MRSGGVGRIPQGTAAARTLSRMCQCCLTYDVTVAPRSKEAALLLNFIGHLRLHSSQPKISASIPFTCSDSIGTLAMAHGIVSFLCLCLCGYFVLRGRLVIPTSSLLRLDR